MHSLNRTSVATAAAATALLQCAAAAGQTPPDSKSDTPAPAAIPIELFTAPRPKHIDFPQFPPSEQRQSNEGWVELSLMVDPTGKPFEVTVIRSTGNKTFEELATKAVERATFDPGSLNGKPIESGFEIKYKFEFTTPSSGARSEFVRAYKALSSAVKSGDRAAADAAMKNLKVTNLYEDAYLGLATYAYATRWGDKLQQLEGLQRAIAEEDHARYLPSDFFRSTLLTRFGLEVDMHHYAEAMMTWKRLEQSRLDRDTTRKVQGVVSQLQAIRTDSTAYDVQGAITDGKWFLHLYKRHFQAQVSDGLITEVKLRCDKRYFFFAFDPTLQYQVNGDAGNCSIELAGTPGTRFKLVQF